MHGQQTIPDIDAAVARLAADTVYPPEGDPQRVTGLDRPRRLALVLSGGGASGAFEAGVIEETVLALERHNSAHPHNRLEVAVVIGTSTGALNTYGRLLDALAAAGRFREPRWIAQQAGHTLNLRLWRRLAAFASPSRTVLDKSWLLHLLQGAGRLRCLLTWFALLVVTPLVLLGAFVLPGIACAGGLSAALPGVPAWLPATAALLLLAALMAFLARRPGCLQRSGRPVLSAAACLVPGALLLGILKAALLAWIAAHPWDAVAGYGAALLLAPVLLVQVLWSLCGDALFGNSRLKRLLAAVGDGESSGRGLCGAVSRRRAEAAGEAVATRLCQAWEKGGMPACIFTATNLSAEKQGLFLLAGEADCQALAAGHWLPIRFSAASGAPAAGGTIAPARLLRGIVASTAIPATYPPEILAYRYAGYGEERRHVFVDGGVLDFAAYHAAIDLGCTHILAVETDSMDRRMMETRAARDWCSLFTNVAGTARTGSEEEAREEAARVARTNRKVVYEGLKKKHLVLFLRIAPRLNERMIDADEFDGRYKDGRCVQTLGDWIEYGRRVNPQSGALPPVIWYRDPNGVWQENRTVRGPLIWDASFQASPEGADR